MIKQDEIYYPKSCWNKAQDYELMFILLERDRATVQTIRFWVQKRLELGKNSLDDEQIQEALNLANLIESHQKMEDSRKSSTSVEDIKK